MPSKNYTTIALPKDLIILVDEFLKENKWGYRTRPELVAAGVRDLLLRYEGKTTRRR